MNCNYPMWYFPIIDINETFQTMWNNYEMSDQRIRQLEHPETYRWTSLDQNTYPGNISCFCWGSRRLKSNSHASLRRLTLHVIVLFHEKKQSRLKGDNDYWRLMFRTVYLRKLSISKDLFVLRKKVVQGMPLKCLCDTIKT